MNFKKGDKVVLYKTSHGYTQTKVGWRGTYQRNWDSLICEVHWENLGNKELPVKIDDLIHEHLYNSPLMEVLK